MKAVVSNPQFFKDTVKTISALVGNSEVPVFLKEDSGKLYVGAIDPTAVAMAQARLVGDVDEGFETFIPSASLKFIEKAITKDTNEVVFEKEEEVVKVVIKEDEDITEFAFTEAVSSDVVTFEQEKVAYVIINKRDLVSKILKSIGAGLKASSTTPVIIRLNDDEFVFSVNEGSYRVRRVIKINSTTILSYRVDGEVVVGVPFNYFNLSTKLPNGEVEVQFYGSNAPVGVRAFDDDGNEVVLIIAPHVIEEDEE